MLLIGKGLDKHSHMYFYTPTNTAKKLLYYPLCAGEFYCNESYCVERDKYNSYLILAVLDGAIQSEGVTVKSGEILLVDCYKKHKYYSNSSAHTLWFHFDGNSANKLFYELYNTHGAKLPCNLSTMEKIRKIISMVKGNADEFELSETLYSVICSLLQNKKSENKKTYISKKAIEYIENNYSSNIKVEDISASVNMSASYFSSVFKKETTFSPYEYLLNVRLEKAKELLLKTDLSITEIAYKTGFNSNANFICFFKKETGISPYKFRKISF